MSKTTTPLRVEGTDIDGIMVPILCRLIRESGTTKENIENSYKLEKYWRRNNIS